MTGWWRRRSKRRNCFHHDHRTGESWILSQILDPGKMFWCKECDQRWFV